MTITTPSFLLFARTLVNPKMPLTTAYIWAEPVGKALFYRKLLLNATLAEQESTCAILPHHDAFKWQVDLRSGTATTFEAAWTQMPHFLIRPYQYHDSAMVKVATLLTPELEYLWRVLHRPNRSLPLSTYMGDNFNATL